MKQKFSLSLTLALIMAMLVTNLALADNVQNDVTSGGNDTFTLGGSTVISYRIAANSGDGQSGCNASDGSPAIVTINTPFGVTASPNPLSFSACSTFLPTTFTASAAGNYIITVSVSDPGTGTYNTTPATFTLHVMAPVDTTPPVINPNVSGTLGDNGWYVSDVTVSWTVVDNESTPTYSCPSTTINADTAGTTLTCSASSLGGTSTESIIIKRDATAPTISGSASPAPNGAGWNKTDVDVSFSCSDATSGIATCGPDQTLSSEGFGQSTSGTAVDNAGNSASATVSNINIDKTKPVVAVTGVTDGAEYKLGSVPAAGCSTTDALSGVATYASLNISGGPVGPVIASCTGAMDNAGNSGSASVTYNVIYNWTGFFQPIDNNMLNVAKGGSGIPVKFSLSGNQGLSIFTAGYPRSVKISCDSSLPTDEIETTVTAGGSSLSYDTLADQYVYVWKTEKTWANSCRQLQVMLNDGTTHTANFKFK